MSVVFSEHSKSPSHRKGIPVRDLTLMKSAISCRLMRGRAKEGGKGSHLCVLIASATLWGGKACAQEATPAGIAVSLTGKPTLTHGSRVKPSRLNSRTTYSSAGKESLVKVLMGGVHGKTTDRHPFRPANLNAGIYVVVYPHIKYKTFN